jgi:hypothetical protein
VTAWQTHDLGAVRTGKVELDGDFLMRKPNAQPIGMGYEFDPKGL